MNDLRRDLHKEKRKKIKRIVKMLKEPTLNLVNFETELALLYDLGIEHTRQIVGAFYETA